MEKIEQKIKDLFKTKEAFCSKFGYKYKDFSSKLRTVEAKINWLNKFLEPLNLKVSLSEIGSSDSEVSGCKKGFDHEWCRIWEERWSCEGCKNEMRINNRTFIVTIECGEGTKDWKITAPNELGARLTASSNYRGKQHRTLKCVEYGR